MKLVHVPNAQNKTTQHTKKRKQTNKNPLNTIHTHQRYTCLRAVNRSQIIQCGQTHVHEESVCCQCKYQAHQTGEAETKKGSEHAKNQHNHACKHSPTHM